MASQITRQDAESDRIFRDTLVSAHHSLPLPGYAGEQPPVPAGPGRHEALCLHQDELAVTKPAERSRQRLAAGAYFGREHPAA